MLKLHYPGLDLETVVREDPLGPDNNPVDAVNFFTEVLPYALETERLCTLSEIIE